MKYSKYQIPHDRREVGFTLVETLVAIALVAVAGGIVSSLTVIVIRSGARTQSIKTINDSGTYALAKMTDVVRTAKEFGGIGNNEAVLESDCTGEYGQDPDSGIPVEYKVLKVTSAYQEELTFACDNTQGTITANGITLLDTSHVKTVDCVFTCRQDYSNNPPIITISFTLKNALDADDTNTIPFTSSSTLRNLTR